VRPYSSVSAKLKQTISVAVLSDTTTSASVLRLSKSSMRFYAYTATLFRESYLGICSGLSPPARAIGSSLSPIT
jgi:hypothetical protein